MPHAVAAEAPHAVAADGTHAVAGDGSHAVAGDGSHAVAADRRAVVCRISRVSPHTTPLNELTSVLSSVLVRAFRFSDCEGDNVVAKVRTNYKVSTRPPATLPLSPRVLICIF